jgi:hypothetical protein
MSRRNRRLCRHQVDRESRLAEQYYLCFGCGELETIFYFHFAAPETSSKELVHYYYKI